MRSRRDWARALPTRAADAGGDQEPRVRTSIHSDKGGPTGGFARSGRFPGRWWGGVFGDVPVGVMGGHFAKVAVITDVVSDAVLRRRSASSFCCR